VNDAAGLQVWTDRSGARVPVTRIQSFAGPAHCSWQSITFLVLDAGGGGAASKKQQQFLRDPDGELAEFERGRFRAHTALPGRAHDTGLSRAGRELWLAADGSAAYLVSKSDPSDVERWPAATQPIGCA
jgi:hypothetical protein